MSLPPRKRDRGVKKNAHARSAIQEKGLAAKYGGQVVKGSGSGFDKGDVRVKGIVRLEAKCTEKQSFSVTRKMIEKIEDAAVNSGEFPAMVIEFIDEKGNPVMECAVTPTWVIRELINNASEQTSQ